MYNPVAPDPESLPGDAVMVFSCWTRGVAGELVARATMSAGEQTRVRTLASREQLHEALDQWLDEALEAP